MDVVVVAVAVVVIGAKLYAVYVTYRLLVTLR